MICTLDGYIGLCDYEFFIGWRIPRGVGLLLVILLFYSIWVNSNKNEESDIMKAGLSALLIFSFFSYPFSFFPLLLFCPFLCGLMQYKIYCNFRITNLKRILMILMTVILMIRTSKDILFLESISCSLLTLYEKNGSEDRKSTRLNSSHRVRSRMPSSA